MIDQPAITHRWWDLRRLGIDHTGRICMGCGVRDDEPAALAPCVKLAHSPEELGELRVQYLGPVRDPR